MRLYALIAALVCVACGPPPPPRSGVLDPTDEEIAALGRARATWAAWSAQAGLVDSVPALIVSPEHGWIKDADSRRSHLLIGAAFDAKGTKRTIVGMYLRGYTLYVRSRIQEMADRNDKDYSDMLFLVGIHEFGHALGGPIGGKDGHSTRETSVLYPTIQFEACIYEDEFAHHCYDEPCGDACFTF